MKSSKYNVFFDYEDQKIGFNSYSREYIALDPMVYLMYESAHMAKDFSEIEDFYKELYDFLIEKGFLVENDVDELKKVMDLVDLVDNDESVYEIHVNPTMNCNFKCWYCYETHIKDSKMDEDTINRTILLAQKVIEEKKEKLKRIRLGWFGGEPLLYYKKVIVPILEKVNELCDANNILFSSSATTNGLLVDQNLIETGLPLKLDFFQITLDGHRERHDKIRFITDSKGSYDAIVSNIKMLVKNKYQVSIRLNCSPETILDINNIIADFQEVSAEDREYMSFDFHKVWQDESNIPDEAMTATRKYFRKAGFHVTSGVHDLVLHSCYGDHKNHATVNYNGEVFKCTARDFTTSNHEGVLEENGGISWNPKYERRLNSKFKNPPCLECAILPICNGGCSQQAIEHEGVDYCINNFDENKKRQLVIDRFLEVQAEQE